SALADATFGPALHAARAGGFGPCSALPRTARSFLGLLACVNELIHHVSASLNRVPTRGLIRHLVENKRLTVGRRQCSRTRPSVLARLCLARHAHSSASLHA